jgi:membrane-associated phospholipid phosphatase
MGTADGTRRGHGDSDHDGEPVGGPGSARHPGAPEHPAGLDRHLGHLDHLDAARVRSWPAVAAVLALVLAAATAVTAAFVGVGPARVDMVVLDEAVDARSGWLTALAVAVTNAGSTAVMGLLAALVVLALLRARRPHDAVFIGVTAVGASLVFTGLKRLLDRARPPLDDRLVGVGNESLPSGHATMAVAVIGSLVVLVWAGRSAAARAAIVAVAALWVAAVGLTRIYLGVHWFSDVLAGWLVGGAWLALCATVWAALARRRALQGRA